MKKSRIFLLSITIIICFLLAATISFPWTNKEIFDPYAVISRTLKIINNDYVTEIDQEELTRKAVTHLVEGLDQWSTYFPPDRFADFDDEIEGHFGGIGVFFELVEDGFLVKAVLPEGPADTAGIQKGDKITSVSGEELKNRNTEVVKHLIRGPVGSEVILTVTKPDGLTTEIKLVRDIINDPCVHMVSLVATDPPVGLIRVERFQSNTSDKIKDALEQLIEQKIQGLVLDFRNNPGGLYTEAIKVADLFLSQGVIVRTQGKQTLDKTTVHAKPADLKSITQIAVLINGKTASAAELVSAALREHKKAVLVGEPSFGKFCVQTVYELFGQGRRFGALKLTTKRYITPHGTSLKDGHIQVDAHVKITEDTRVKLIHKWHESLKESWQNPTDPLEKQVNPEGDPTLKKALEILNSVQQYKKLLSSKLEAS